MKLKQNARIGIWGYGIVGKAVSNYFAEQGYTVSIMDKKQLSVDEMKKLAEKNIDFYFENSKNQFFYIHDYLFSSSGVDIAQDYPTYKHKWLQELDMFSSLFNKKIIAVTGSIGKTSVTTMLSSLLKLADIPACTGGNIGIATFNLLSQKDNVDYAVLEVSSFQLEHCSLFAPHIAIITNIHSNHLDHHETEENYFLAKYNILAHQTSNDHAIIHFSLREKLIGKHFTSKRSFFCAQKPADTLLAQLKNNESVYYCDNNIIMHYYNGNTVPVLPLTKSVLSFSFLENIIILTAVCDILGIPVTTMLNIPEKTVLPEHRLEHITTINGIDFYNDSKSTTTASTLAAIQKLHHRPLHLFLGGLSKGVNREPFIADIQSYVHHVYCFGKEADELYHFCKQHNIPASSFINLEQAFNDCMQRIHNNDIVLFSPAGSSYDLYDNFEKRGKHFKELVTKHK